MRALADPDNMPQVFKKTYKANRIIFNSAYITVVNYNDEILIMTSMVKKKIPTTKKITTMMIMNTTKWMKIS